MSSACSPLRQTLVFRPTRMSFQPGASPLAPVSQGQSGGGRQASIGLVSAHITHRIHSLAHEPELVIKSRWIHKTPGRSQAQSELPGFTAVHRRSAVPAHPDAPHWRVDPGVLWPPGDIQQKSLPTTVTIGQPHHLAAHHKRFTRARFRYPVGQRPMGPEQGPERAQQTASHHREHRGGQRVLQTGSERRKQPRAGGDQ